MDRMVTEIERRARLFCKDNHFAGYEKVIQAAMMIGASVALEDTTAEMHGDTDTSLEELFSQPLTTHGQ